jgi:pimeloyl-ACP methyl ester carboxylesterase
MNHTYSFRLEDGRMMGYSESGDPEGFPVFFFHGFPGSRLIAADFHHIAQAEHCRLIGIDRPGMGLSSPNKQYTILDWTDDVQAVAVHLNITRFSILAHSGGVPFALACAYKIPNRISHVALVSGMPPVTHPEIRRHLPSGLRILHALVRHLPGFSNALMQLQRKILLRPHVFNKMIRQCPEPDQLVLQNHKQAERSILALKEAFTQGVSGAAYEFQILSKEWDIGFEDIQMPISIWQGRLDKQVLVPYAQFYKCKLPQATLHIFENDAHLSTLYHHMSEIIKAAMA